jgi:hypothetical protein
MRPRSVFHARPVKEARIPDQVYTYVEKTKNPEKSMVRLLRLMVDYGLEPYYKLLKRPATIINTRLI